MSLSSPVDIGRNEAVVRLVLGGVYGRVEAEAPCWLPPSGVWDETRCTDAPAVERSKTALPRCDVDAGHLLRACSSTADMWRVLGAHVAGFHPNTPNPETTARRLRRLFERAAAATVRLRVVLGGPRARE